MSTISSKFLRMIYHTIKVNEEFELTQIYQSDRACIARYINDPEIYNNTLVIPYPYSEEDAEFYINMVQDAEKEERVHKSWAIRHQNGEMVGGIGLLYNDGLDSHRSELGYWISRHLWGKGIMTQVVKTFTDYILENTDLIKLCATVFETNKASARVLEKVGYESEGFLKKHYLKDGKYLNGVAYAIIKDD